MDNQDNRMTVREIAEVVGTTTSTVYNWISEGKHLTWHRSSNGRAYALKDEVMEFAEGYIGRGRRRESATN